MFVEKLSKTVEKKWWKKPSSLPPPPQRLKTVFTIFENIYFLNGQKKPPRKHPKISWLFSLFWKLKFNKKTPEINWIFKKSALKNAWHYWRWFFLVSWQIFVVSGSKIGKILFFSVKIQLLRLSFGNNSPNSQYHQK